MKITEKDLKILAELGKNSKNTVALISAATGVPVTTVHNRIKQMERSGVIKKYTLELNHAILGNTLTAYLMIHTNTMLANGMKVNQKDIANEIKEIKGVEKVELLAGHGDILTKVRAKDTAELNESVMQKVRKIDGVDKTQTMVVLEEF
ncbi:winged helix-turn-helix transcriptional regulator [Candidatus Woesearchaeota archaeon]|nr:winged helix-turn-helix transcriptional regulator [Candidatus Woesearchaeota archaeon]